MLVAVASKENLTQTDLVKLTGIDRSTLAELVARMTAKGFLKRTRAKNDARANIVSLTAKGRTLLNKAEPVVKKADAAILDIIAASKRSAFLSILKSIAESLDARTEASTPAKAAPKAAAKSTAKSKTAKKAAPKRKAAPKTRTAAKPAKSTAASRATKAKKPTTAKKPRTKK